MILNNEVYEIEIVVDETYTINSTDNNHYDYVYNPYELGDNDFINVYSIKIKSNEKVINIALIGGLYSNIDNCAVLHNAVLIVLLFFFTFRSLLALCLVFNLQRF